MEARLPLGKEAYFTFADRPFLIIVALILIAVVTGGVIVHSAKQETKAFKRYP
jgi:hypothetical protein